MIHTLLVEIVPSSKAKKLANGNDNMEVPNLKYLK